MYVVGFACFDLQKKLTGAPERFLIPEYSVVAEDLGVGVDFVLLRETPMLGTKTRFEWSPTRFAVQEIERLRMKLRGKKAN